MYLKNKLHDKTDHAVRKFLSLKLKSLKALLQLYLKKLHHLYKPDDVWKDEEGVDVVHPLEEPEEDEGPPVDDEPGREDGPHPPHGQVLAHQWPWD